jgi:hypothetical protein
MTDVELRALAEAIQQGRQSVVVVRETLLPILEEAQPMIDEVFSSIALAQGEAVIRLMNQKGMTSDQAIAIVTGSSQFVTSAVSNAVEQIKKAMN